MQKIQEQDPDLILMSGDIMDDNIPDFDLVLSGHAHGGQWCIPILLPNGLLAPEQGLFPKYTKGISEENGTKMLVSRGLSRMRIPRVFNAPELIVLDLRPVREP